MKISELIETLNNIIKQHGDKYVFLQQRKSENGRQISDIYYDEGDDEQDGSVIIDFY